MTAVHEHRGPWTFDEVMALPEDGRRYELIDGNLIVSPPPSYGHQGLSFELAVLLRDAIRAAQAPVRIFEAVGVQIDEELVIPDIVVVRKETVKPHTTLAQAADVELVVEVVSPGSRIRDRGDKLYLYAEAGIPYFWRVETMHYRGRTKDLPVVITHELVGLAEYGVKQTAGAGETLRVEEPFPVEFDPGTLVTF